MGALAHEVDTKQEPTTNGVDEVPMQDLSDLSDAGSEEGSETASASSNRQKISARQKDRHKAHAVPHAMLRQIARDKIAAEKQALTEHRRLDEEVNKIERRLEAIEREFRKLLGAIRVKPMGKDRFHNRIWWFDGLGSGSLQGSGGVVQYGTARIFVQGPTEMDLEMMSKREEDDVAARRQEEEGEGMLASGEWAVYGETEEAG